eukprot:COSAG01_NODE_14148_length_1491_cov_1.128592_1_plen_468_part_01
MAAPAAKEAKHMVTVLRGQSRAAQSTASSAVEAGRSARTLTLSIVWPHFAFSMLPFHMPDLHWSGLIKRATAWVRHMAFLDIGILAAPSCFVTSDQLPSKSVLTRFQVLHVTFWAVVMLFGAISSCSGNFAVSAHASNAWIFVFTLAHAVLLRSSLDMLTCVDSRFPDVDSYNDTLKANTTDTWKEVVGREFVGHLESYPDVSCDVRMRGLAICIVFCFALVFLAKYFGASVLSCAEPDCTNGLSNWLMCGDAPVFCQRSWRRQALFQWGPLLWLFLILLWCSSIATEGIKDSNSGHGEFVWWAVIIVLWFPFLMFVSFVIRVYCGLGPVDFITYPIVCVCAAVLSLIVYIAWVPPVMSDPDEVTTLPALGAFGLVLYGGLLPYGLYRRLLLGGVKDDPDDPKLRAHNAFLLNRFKPGCWDAEFRILGRKAALLFSAAILAGFPTVAIVTQICILSWSLLAQCRERPY